MNKLTQKRNLESSGSITINEENVIEISFASPTPYLRTAEDGYTYNEILVISDDSVKWDRLVDQKCPLLLDHDMEKQIGVVEKAWIEGDKLKALVRFSECEFAQMILKDVKDGIRRNVSFGYIINEHRTEKKQDEPDNVYITNFETYEISIVSCPADPNVGYKRSLLKDDINMNNEEEKDITTQEEKEITPQEEVKDITQEEEKEIQPEEEKEVEINEEETQSTEDQTEERDQETDNQTSEDEIDESNEIKTAGELIGEEQLAEDCIKNKRSLEDFKKMVKSKRNINSNKNDKKDIQMKKYFSISKAIRNACSQYKADVSKDYETEVINENKRSLGINDEYDVVVSRRALAPTAGNGKELITGEYLPQEFVPALRPATSLGKTGYRLIPSTGHSVSFAVVTKGADAKMYDLDGNLEDSGLTFATKELKPRKSGVCVPIPYSLLLQSRPEIDAIVTDDVVKALDELKDKMALIGSGANNEPTGIANTTGINEMSIAEIFTWEGVCEAERLIRDTNDMTEKLYWVMNSTNYNKFKTTLKDNVAGAEYLLEDGKINGYEAVINNALDDNTIILGNFDELVVTPFDGIFIKVDDITYIKKGAVQVICTEAFDTLVRRPGSFTVTKAAE